MSERCPGVDRLRTEPPLGGVRRIGCTRVALDDPLQLGVSTHQEPHPWTSPSAAGAPDAASRACEAAGAPSNAEPMSARLTGEGATEVIRWPSGPCGATEAGFRCQRCPQAVRGEQCPGVRSTRRSFRQSQRATDPDSRRPGNLGGGLGELTENQSGNSSRAGSEPEPSARSGGGAAHIVLGGEADAVGRRFTAGSRGRRVPAGRVARKSRSERGLRTPTGAGGAAGSSNSGNQR